MVVFIVFSFNNLFSGHSVLVRKMTVSAKLSQIRATVQIWPPGTSVNLANTVLNYVMAKFW